MTLRTATDGLTILPSSSGLAKLELFITDEEELDAHQLKSDSRATVVLNIGPLTIYVTSREQAERLFDLVAEGAGIWRQLDPEGFKLDAAMSMAFSTSRTRW